MTKTLEASNKVGVNTSCGHFDLDSSTIGCLTDVGEEFPIREQVDRGATIKEDPFLIDDGVTLLELGHHCSTAIIVWNGR